MHILIIGASKGIGLKTVERALACGHRVRAFARSASGIGIDHPDLETFDGDARDADDVARAVDGVDAVAVALGIRERLAMLWEEETLFSDSARVLIPAMRQAGVRRLIAVTGFGAGDSKRAMSSLERIGHRALLGRPYADKDRQEALIEASGLDWTIVRPAILTSGGPSRRYRVLADPSTWRNGLISRSDVADFLVAALENGSHSNRAVVLAR